MKPGEIDAELPFPELETYIILNLSNEGSGQRTILLTDTAMPKADIPETREPVVEALRLPQTRRVVTRPVPIENIPRRHTTKVITFVNMAGGYRERRVVKPKFRSRYGR